MFQAHSKNFGAARRHGSAYMLVIGIAMLVTVLGMGALMATRASSRTVMAGTDWEEAGTLAIAATEHAMSYLNAAATASPAGWRSVYTSGQIAYTQAMGRGSFSWALQDELDGNLSASYLRPIRIFGKGTVGTVTRYYSVQVTPGGAPLDVLRTAVHAAGNITLASNTALVAGIGPISTNATLDMSSASYVNAAIEANAVNGSGSPKGTQTITAPAATKPMPSAAIYSMYSSMATALPPSSAASFSPGLLTPFYNPYGAIDPNGLYSITLPSGTNMTINSSRIVGTLLISASNATITFIGPILWEPARPDFPIIIISATNSTIIFQGSTSWLREATVGMNLNPTASPFEGTSDTNQTDDFPPQFRGLIHIIGSTNNVQLNNNSYFVGTLVTDGTIAPNNQCTAVEDPNIYANPPFGYACGSQLIIVPGSWKWDGPPS